jgi:hypothetical protein
MHGWVALPAANAQACMKTSQCNNKDTPTTDLQTLNIRRSNTLKTPTNSKPVHPAPPYILNLYPPSTPRSTLDLQVRLARPPDPQHARGQLEAWAGGDGGTGADSSPGNWLGCLPFPAPSPTLPHPFLARLGDHLKTPLPPKSAGVPGPHSSPALVVAAPCPCHFHLACPLPLCLSSSFALPLLGGSARMQPHSPPPPTLATSHPPQVAQLRAENDAPRARWGPTRPPTYPPFPSSTPLSPPPPTPSGCPAARGKRCAEGGGAGAAAAGVWAD